MSQLDQTSTGAPHSFNHEMVSHYSGNLAKKKSTIMLPWMPLAKLAVGAFGITDGFKSAGHQSIVLQKSPSPGQYYATRVTSSSDSCGCVGPEWRNSVVVFQCDNEGDFLTINSGYSRVQGILHLLRCLFFIRAHYGIHIRPVHIPGNKNVLADAIS